MSLPLVLTACGKKTNPNLNSIQDQRFEARQNPEGGNDPLPPIVPPTDDSERINRDAPWGDLSTVRIQIFPHLGKLADPQGRETQFDQVTIRSSQDCTMQDLQGIGQRVTAKTINLTLANTQSPVRIDCPKPFTVVRESALKSWEYEGSVIAENGMNPQGTPFVRLINVIGFENYLMGVTPSEMPSSFPKEALKSQAIAARTYAMYEIVSARLKQPNQTWDIDDTVQFQAYVGIAKRTAPTDVAVTDTRGLALLHQGAPIKAYFHADTGGYTELPENVWLGSSLPYYLSRPEKYPLTAVNSEWKLELTLDEITNKLRAANRIGAQERVSKLSIATQFASKRANAITIQTDSGSKNILATELRFALGAGSKGMRSTLFEINATADGYRFDGRGFGHGVGLNQYGARALVTELQWNARQILDFYYPSAAITQVY
jgi:stage II sporulation protein D